MDDITDEIFSFWESAISATERMRWNGLLDLVEDQSRISKVCCREYQHFYYVELLINIRLSCVIFFLNIKRHGVQKNIHLELYFLGFCPTAKHNEYL